MALQSKINNFIGRYGVDKLEWFIEQINIGTSGQVIANEFGVSRERVRQWKNSFGALVTFYQVDPSVLARIKELKKGKG